MLSCLVLEGDSILAVQISPLVAPQCVTMSVIILSILFQLFSYCQVPLDSTVQRRNYLFWLASFLFVITKFAQKKVTQRK